MLVRFSYATKPTPWRGDGSTYKSVPAVSMKFLRDGVPSANVFAMYSVDVKSFCF